MNALPALCSFFIPGLGQLIKGEPLKALACFGFCLIGYMLFIVPGLIMHLFTVLDAVGETRQQRQQRLMLKKVCER